MCVQHHRVEHQLGFCIHADGLVNHQQFLLWELPYHLLEQVVCEVGILYAVVRIGCHLLRGEVLAAQPHGTQYLVALLTQLVIGSQRLEAATNSHGVQRP